MLELSDKWPHSNPIALSEASCKKLFNVLKMVEGALILGTNKANTHLRVLRKLPTAYQCLSA